MQCRKCQTTIADKALICYKCGTPTTDAKYQAYVPARTRTTRPLVYIVVGVAVLVLLAWFLLHSSL